MGAWGTGPFENDDAADWIAVLEQASDGAVAAALTAASGPSPDSEASSVGIAAAALVALALEGRLDELPVDQSEWLSPPEGLTQLVPLARTTIAAVRSGSELRQLWEESEDLGTWLRELDTLEQRLSALL